MLLICLEGRNGERERIHHLLSTRCLDDQESIASEALYKQRGSFVNSFIWVTVWLLDSVAGAI